MPRCIRCGKELNTIDIGAYKKFINRGSTEFMCKSCLADDLKVPEELIDKKNRIESNILKNKVVPCFSDTRITLFARKLNSVITG